MVRYRKPIDPRPRVADRFTMPVSLSDNGYMQKIDPRRRPEIEDSRLIQEDDSAMANLPTYAIHSEWTPGRYSPHVWMETEVEPWGNVYRDNEPEGF